MSAPFYGLADQLRQWIRAQLEEHNFKASLHCVAVARNGSMYYIRYDDAGDGGLAMEELASHHAGEVFPLPIHIMLTDRLGACGHIAFDRETN